MHFQLFFELIQHLLLLIYHIFFKCHWICFLVLTSRMLNLYPVFGIILITCTPFLSCPLNVLQFYGQGSIADISCEQHWDCACRWDSALIFLTFPEHTPFQRIRQVSDSYGSNPGSTADRSGSNFAAGSESILWLQRQKTWRKN